MNQLSNKIIGAPSSLTADAATEYTLRLSENAAMKAPNGHTYLVRSLTGDARAILQRRLREIELLLYPSSSHADQQRAASAIARMLSGFLNARSGDSKSTIATYVAMISDHPIWAIESACAKIAHGMFADINPDFAPSAARLHQVVGVLLLELLGERKKIADLLDAPVRPAHEPTADEHDRVVFGFKKLGDELRQSSPVDAGMEARRKAERDRRAMERNDEEIIAEYRSHGLEPVMMGNGRPVSLTLARKTGAVQTH